MSASLEQIRKHWDERAALGQMAGTQDLGLKRLEQDAILSAISEAAGGRQIRILEIGCGIGETARRLSLLAGSLDAIDASPEMINQALKLGSYGVRFAVGDVLNPPAGPYDVIYTQRCLINLPTWELQKQAIDAIADRLVPGGRFLMCEHSLSGLFALNAERSKRRLPVINEPWHNRYLTDGELSGVTSLTLLRCVPFSAAYYFQSRVLNAVYADAHGKQPDYDSPINRVNVPCDPKFAQGRLWVWEKP